jgi:(4-O-methyl)-D-glucuronate---lignin esterase
VYLLLGAEGLPADDMPEFDSPVMGGIGYHIRPGVHDVTSFDWDRYMDFADKHFGSE